MEPKLSDLANLVKELDEKGIKEFVQLETETIHPKFVLPSQVESVLIKNLSPDGKLYVNDDLNAIMITDVKSKIERIKEILSIIDVPPKQVLIEGKIVIAEADWFRSLGIDTRVGGYVEIEGFAQKRGLYAGKLDMWSYGGLLIFILGKIEAAEMEGKVETRSLPTLIVQNNKEGKIYSTEPEVNDRYREYYGIVLSIIPRIGEDSFINMEINCRTKPQPRRYEEEEGKGIHTTVMIKDGTPFAIGGLEYTETTYREIGIPILRNIPILGYLFKRKMQTTTKKELLIIITPHILEFGEHPKK